MKSKYFGLLLCSLILGACNKVEVATPDFEVSTLTKSVKAGEELTFQFTGDPDQISFYSGEPLSDYTFKSGRTVSTEGLDLSFTTTVQYGAQKDQLSILYSTDFSGNYTLEDIRKATWVDVTKDYALATGTTQKTWGPKDMESLMVDGKPIYIAFRYVGLPKSTDGVPRTWTIRSFELNTMSDLGPLQVADHTGAGFKLVQDGPIEPSRSSIASSSIVLRGNSVDQETPIDNWAITKPIMVGDIDMGPDRPTPIKGFVDTKSSDYKYIYTTPGTYKATFVASNANIYGAKEVIKQIEITVTP